MKSIERELDEKTKKEIEDIVYIMKNIDETGRTLLIRDGNTLLARQKLSLSHKTLSKK